jgi:hypothetical protein
MTAQLPLFPRTREQVGSDVKTRWPRYPLRVGRRVRVSGVDGAITRRYPEADGSGYRYEVEGLGRSVSGVEVEAVL